MQKLPSLVKPAHWTWMPAKSAPQWNSSPITEHSFATLHTALCSVAPILRDTPNRSALCGSTLVIRSGKPLPGRQR